MRDEAPKLWQRKIYGVLALGWRGCAVHWNRYQTAYLLLAGLSTPLVVSVHSVVSLDFSVAIVPGWHSTIFPPYFVAGAIFSGFAMVLTLAIPLRKFYQLENFITLKHLENCAKLLLTTGLIVAYSYAVENFISWYSDNVYESYMAIDRVIGHYRVAYWLLILFNIIIVQLLWWKSIRQNVLVLFIISVLVNIGMWLERFVIVVGSLSRDYMPSAWHIFVPTIWDYAILIGSIGLFFLLFLLFVRTLPSISISELSELNHKTFEGKEAI
jgi:molybdopterin-containing oxidoreductase family membrane subunit